MTASEYAILYKCLSVSVASSSPRALDRIVTCGLAKLVRISHSFLYAAPRSSVRPPFGVTGLTLQVLIMNL